MPLSSTLKGNMPISRLSLQLSLLAGEKPIMETDMQKKEIYANFKHSSPNISFINKNEQLKITKHLGKPRVTKSKDKKAE